MGDFKKLNDYRRIMRDELRNIHYSMFEYKNLPKTVDPLYLETYLQMGIPEGFVAWWRLNESEASTGFPAGSLIVTSASFGADLNPYGEGAEVIAVTRNGHERRFKSRYGDDVAIGFNNTLRTPCFDIDVEADNIAEVDLSLQYLTHYTRLYPLFKVADEKTKEKLKVAFKNMELGVPMTIIDDNIIFEGLDESNASSIKTEMLTQPELSRVIEYTSKLREDLKRWHLTKYGQTINSSSKLAQETVDEVNGAVSASLILPLSMLEARRQIIDEVNAKFGTDIEVDFSGAWRAEVTRYEDISGEDAIDGTGDKAETENNEEEVNDDAKNETERDSEKSDDNDTV